MPKRQKIAKTLALAGNTFVVTLTALYALWTFGVLDSSEDQLATNDGVPVGVDFMVFWTTGVLTEQGHLLDLFDREDMHKLQQEVFGRELPAKPRIWPYPPPMLFVTLPIAQFPYHYALAGFSVLMLGAYLSATRSILLLAAPASLMNLLFGQTGFLVGALFIGALRIVGRRPVLAGILFGLIAVKPHLGILIPVALLAARAWRTIASAALTVCMLVLLSGLIFGWEAWRLWFVEVLPHQNSIIGEGVGGDIQLSVWQAARSLGLPIWAAWFIQGLCAIIAMIATWRAFSQARSKTLSETKAHSVLLMATALASPYLFNYDWTLIAPVALAALRERARKGWTHTGPWFSSLSELLVWLLVWTLPLFWIFQMPSVPVPVLAGFVLPAALVLVARRGVRETPRT